MDQSDAISAPVVLWDGECGFCRRWIEYWKTLVGDDVQFIPFQKAPPEQLESWDLDVVELERAMHFVDEDERIFRGAQAVGRLLSGAGHTGYILFYWLYQNVEAFRVVVDGSYRFIASHRVLAARLTTFLWGEPHRATFQVGRWMFLRGLALSAFIAFWSMSQQVGGLLGSEGILPAADFIERVSTYVATNELSSWEQWSTFPTIFWFSASDAMLEGVCAAGMVGAMALFVGFVPRLLIPALWLGYLSIMSVGQVFLGYQWDALLLEALAVGWFVAPWTVLPRVESRREVSRVGRFLVWLLVFKLIFLSGWVKVRADEAWRTLEALHYHFWTQPIPNAVAWYVEKMPDVMKSMGVAFTLAAEFAAPLLIFAPRRLRHIGALMMIGLQVGIGLTGTYGFFNILTIALCLMLFDDRFVHWASRGRLETKKESRPRPRGPWHTVARAGIILAMGGLLSLPMFRSLGVLSIDPPRAVRSLRTFNSYGLFASMTKKRPEIGVEVSRDGETWEPVDFRWKPTAVDEPLRPTTFHMPRLDWQMWFAALGSCQQNRWFHAFLRRLMQGSDPVERLLEEYDPDQSPPRYVRTPYYEYEFGDDQWWTRREIGHYCPPLTLDAGENLVLAE